MIKVLTEQERIEKLEHDLLASAEFSGELTEKGKSVNRGIRDLGISKGEELAIMRKALMYLIEKHGDSNDSELAEFVAYFNKVERVKAEVEEQANR